MDCTHQDGVDPAMPPRVDGYCEECVKEGSSWVALRVCKTCGHVGCCDSSERRHARAHYHETGHAIMGPASGGHGDWLWCYVCDAYIEPRT